MPDWESSGIRNLALGQRVRNDAGRCVDWSVWAEERPRTSGGGALCEGFLMEESVLRGVDERRTGCGVCVVC